MPSQSLTRWRSEANGRLDEIVQAHSAVGGTVRGRRVATQQVNHAYAMLLSSHFQGFCRDLHTEAIDHICNSLTEPWARLLLRAELTANRKLDRGNPNPGALGADFGRLGMDLWPELRRLDGRTEGRNRRLEKLNHWRNAIAHQDFSKVDLLDLEGGRMTLRLADVRSWRKACEQLAATVDRAVAEHITGLVGASPW